MAFPSTVLSTKVEVVINNVLTDITTYVNVDDIEISRGSDDETVRTQPAKARFRLNNLDGRFSPRNPNGPYFGFLNRNNGILISVSDGDRYLDVAGAGYAQVADTAQIDITGDIDIRVDATLRDWTGHDGTTELIGKHATGGQRSWLVLMTGGTITYEWSADGSATTSVASDAIVADPTGRLAVRITHDVNNGASGNTVTFYTAPTIDGPWEQHGEPVVTAGTTSLFNSTAALRVGDAMGSVGFANPYGKIWAAKVFNGINGTVAADINFRIQDDGDTSFTGADGLTWTTHEGAVINNQYNRFRGEVVAWPQRWTTGAKDAWVPIEAQSLLRRHNQGNKALESTMRRRIPSDSSLVAYWPCEDGEDATQFGSTSATVMPITFRGDVDPAAHPGPPGSADLPSFNGGATWYVPIPGPASATNQFQVEWIVNIQQATATAHSIQQIQTTGTVLTWKFLVDNGGARIQGYSRTGALVVNEAFVLTQSEVVNHWVRWRFRANQNGGNVDWDIGFIPIGGTGVFSAFSFAGTVGRPSAAHSPESFSADLDGLSWGHLAVFSSDSTDIFNDADIGFAGETAWARIDRLLDEQGEPVTMQGASTRTPTMGAQRPDKLIDLLQEAADADYGILTDNRDTAGFTEFKFVGRSCLHWRYPALILGYTDDGEVHAPLDPTDDDQYTRNLVTATRERGASATYERTDGALGTALIGTYDSELTVNIEKDDRIIDYAGWEVHLGTWNEERYPTVLVKLHAAPHLMSQALAVDVGSRIRLTDARNESTRTWIPPGDIELLVRGYKETISQFIWEIEFQCVPARAWDVNLLNHLGQYTKHLKPTAIELSEALDTTETAVETFTTDGFTWTDDVEDTPFYITVGGEEMRVVAPGNFINANPFFDVSTTSWSGASASIARTTSLFPLHPTAIASLAITPAGAVAAVSARTDLSAVGTVGPGQRYVLSGWLYLTTASSDIRMQAQWYDSAGASISNSGTAVSIAAKTWTYFEETVTAPASASRYQLAARLGGTPASTDVYYVWGARMTRIKASLVYDEFGRTDTDTWTMADSSQTWTNSGGAAADYDVLSGYGRHINTAVTTPTHSVIANTEADADVYTTLTTAATSTGASQFAGPIIRYTDANNLYHARVEFTTANVVTLSIRKRVASVETQLATFTTEITHSAAQNVRVRFQAIGTALKAKIWLASGVEPGPWTLTATDSALSSAGSVGVKSERNTGNTNANAEFRFDNFEMVNPQVLTVERSFNNIVKSHSSGAAVALTYPMPLAL